MAGAPPGRGVRGAVPTALFLTRKGTTQLDTNQKPERGIRPLKVLNSWRLVPRVFFADWKQAVCWEKQYSILCLLAEWMFFILVWSHFIDAIWARCNAFPWYLLILQKLLCCKWHHWSVKSFDDTATNMKFRKIKQTYRTSIIARVTKDHVLVLDRGALSKFHDILPHQLSTTGDHKFRPLRIWAN